MSLTNRMTAGDQTWKTNAAKANWDHLHKEIFDCVFTLKCGKDNNTLQTVSVKHLEKKKGKTGCS